MSNLEQIRQLLYQYAYLIDSGDFEAVGALFSKATVIAPAAPAGAQGAEAVAAMFRDAIRLYEDGRPATKHLVSNALIELEPDEQQARAQSYLTVLQCRPDFPMQLIIGASYSDQFVRELGHWRFEQRIITVDMVGDLSRHLLDTSIL